MRIENATPLPVVVSKSSIAGDQMVVLVVCAMTCSVGDGAKLRLAATQQPVMTEEDERGAMQDTHFLRLGVSVCAKGFVYASERGGAQGKAVLTAGDRSWTVLAFGGRVWRQGALGLSATAPLAFERVEMSWEHAYGGFVKQSTMVLSYEGEDLIVPESPVASVFNPTGMGFYLHAEQAVNQPLPFLERPDAPIHSWNDRPEPACLAPYPVWGGLRARAMLDPTGQRVVMQNAPQLMSRAAPGRVLERVESGAPVALEGMRPDKGRILFATPDAPLHVTCRIGPDSSPVPLRLDAIDVDAEALEARFVWRGKVQYPLVAFERREIVCAPTAALDEIFAVGGAVS